MNISALVQAYDTHSNDPMYLADLTQLIRPELKLVHKSQHCATTRSGFRYYVFSEAITRYLELELQNCSIGIPGCMCVSSGAKHHILQRCGDNTFVTPLPVLRNDDLSVCSSYDRSKYTLTNELPFELLVLVAEYTHTYPLDDELMFTPHYFASDRFASLSAHYALELEREKFDIAKHMPGEPYPMFKYPHHLRASVCDADIDVDAACAHIIDEDEPNFESIRVMLPLLSHEQITNLLAYFLEQAPRREIIKLIPAFAHYGAKVVESPFVKFDADYDIELLREQVEALITHTSWKLNLFDKVAWALAFEEFPGLNQLNEHDFARFHFAYCSGQLETLYEESYPSRITELTLEKHYTAEFVSSTCLSLLPEILSRLPPPPDWSFIMMCISRNDFRDLIPFEILRCLVTHRAPLGPTDIIYLVEYLRRELWASESSGKPNANVAQLEGKLLSRINALNTAHSNFARTRSVDATYTSTLDELPSAYLAQIFDRTIEFKHHLLLFAYASHKLEIASLMSNKQLSRELIAKTISVDHALDTLRNSCLGSNRALAKLLRHVNIPNHKLIDLFMETANEHILDIAIIHKLVLRDKRMRLRHHAAITRWKSQNTSKLLR